MAAEFKWYCLRAISGKELKVKEILDAEIANSDLGKYVKQVVVPTEKVMTQSGNKRVVKDKVLFSGYIFVQCKLVGEVQSQLANTTNVVNFLLGRNSKKPEPLPDDQVEAMLDHADHGSEQDIEQQLTFMVGEIVKVNDGPFQGFDGEVESINEEKKKLIVLVKVFSRKTQLELSFDQVDKQV